MKKKLLTFVAVFAMTAGTMVAAGPRGNGRAGRQSQAWAQGNGQGQMGQQGKRNGQGRRAGQRGKRQGPRDGTGPIHAPGTGRGSAPAQAGPAQ
jgi:hypothetical protein